MNRIRAQRIVIAYRSILRLFVEFSFGVPESVLPFHKADIKAALQSLLMEVDNERDRRTYVDSYLLLARFLPDLLGYRGLLMQTAVNMDDAAWLAAQEPPADLIETMRCQRTELAQELTRFLGGN